ncbi:zf-HC2 domain-containing protein [Niallia sp. Krafla_26]|uniref:zf-HC2 domain-containing protein n=1 Tax=Niallia sp. Krafla_26 TaxID=3064703 RepID=UPI003D162C11
MKCPTKIITYMHEYLDEEISPPHEKELREHLHSCQDCFNHFHQLRKTIALVQSTSHIEAPTGFTEKLMANLPREKKKVSIQRWFMNHPLLTAASLFIVLMAGSLTTAWNADQQFSVSKQSNLIVQNNTVIVPEGEVVDGDVIVRNGDLQIEGHVKGNVTVINGEPYMASAGKVTGEIKEINQVFEWVWFHIQKTGEDVLNIFEDDHKALE